MATNISATENMKSIITGIRIYISCKFKACNNR